VRWLKLLGWLLVVGSLGFAAALGTGAAKESELVEVSLYLVLAFGFGVGLLLGVRLAGDRPRDALGAIVLGAMISGVAVLGRWYFFKHFW
jgi:hypothetical protein